MTKSASLILFSIIIFIGCGSPSGEPQAVKTDSTVVSSKPQIDPFEEINNQIISAPNNDELYAQRAAIHVNQNDYQSAINDLERAIKIDSTNANHYVLLSTIKFRNKQPKEALALLQKAVKNSPDNVMANLKLGEFYMYAENYEEAFVYINNCLKQDVYNAEAYFLKGMIYKSLKDTAKAVSSFQTCVEQNPDYYDAHLQLGLIYASVYDDLALAYYDNAIEIRPNSVEALYNKALYFQSIKQFTEADNLYKEILEKDPNYYIAFYNMGFLRLVYSDDYDSAAHLFTLAIEKDPNYFEAYYNRGYSFELMEQKDKALLDYKKALNIKPDFTLAAKGISRLE